MDMQNLHNSEKSIASGVVWKFAERFFAQGVSFIVSVILARLLAPEEFGIVAIVMVFIEITNVLVVSGFRNSLIQKKDINETETSTIFYCGIIVSIILYVVMFFTAPLIAAAYENPLITPVLRVFAVRIPITSVQQVPSALLSRKMDFKKFFFSTSVGIIISAVVGIVMAVKGFGVWALVAQNIIAAALDTIILLFVAKWKPEKKFSLRETAPLISYGWKVMAADLISSVVSNISPMIIGLKYNSADLAYYTKGKQLPQVLRNNLSTTLISVLFPAMSNVGNDVQQVKAVTSRSIRMATYVVFPVMTGIFCIADNLVVALYTEKWLLMIPYIRIFCIECMIAIIPIIILQGLMALGHSGIVLKFEFIKKPVLLFAIIIAMNSGVEAVAWTAPINALIGVIVDGMCGVKIIGYRFRDQFKDIFVPLLLSAAMGAVSFSIGFINMNVILNLSLQVTAGAAVYIILSLVFKVDEIKFLLGFVKSKLHR